jgi:hypothetical protein
MAVSLFGARDTMVSNAGMDRTIEVVTDGVVCVPSTVA